MEYRTTDDHRTVKKDKDGSEAELANFEAEIREETRYKDGQSTKTILTITGRDNEEEFPKLEIEAEKFAGLGWVMPGWGVTAVINPGQGIKDDFRTAIQLRSKPVKKTVYTHTGWTSIDGKPAYLHNGGAINQDGNNPNVRVELPHELRNYRMTTKASVKDSVLATLGLLRLASPNLIWPVFASMLSPMTDAVDFACHVTGKTGTYKSEIASLFQSHFGDMDARHLPGSWSSTANALEAQAYRAKNAVFCIDDFIPSGTSWQQKSYQKTADQIIRGQGNQAGRARLTDVSSLQTTMYPRGIILSTGEDTPEGHSVRARMMILELTPDDIDVGALSSSQAARELFQATAAHYIQWLAKNLKKKRENIKAAAKKIRDDNLRVGHSRTPGMLGVLIANAHAFIEWAEAAGAIGTRKGQQLKKISRNAILEAGMSQEQYLVAADPCDAFCEAIRTIIAGHIGHMRTIQGGVPMKAGMLGWTEDISTGDLPMYRPHGKTLGWIDWDADLLYIDATAAYNDIKKHSGGAVTFTKQTMLKRLKDAGLIVRTDDARQRNTIRVTCEGHPRQVIAMPVSTVLQTQEKPEGDNK